VSDRERLRDELETAKQGLATVNDELRRATARRVRQAVQLAAMKAVTDTMNTMKAEAEQAVAGSPGSGVAYAFVLKAAMAEADRLLALLDKEG